MRVNSIETVFAAGGQLAVLILIPVTAVACAVFLVVALHNRKPAAAVTPVLTALVVGLACLALRDAPVAMTARAEFAQSIDSLVLMLPIALGLAALPFLAGPVAALTKTVRRSSTAQSPAFAVASTD